MATSNVKNAPVAKAPQTTKATAKTPAKTALKPVAKAVKAVVAAPAKSAKPVKPAKVSKPVAKAATKPAAKAPVNAAKSAPAKGLPPAAKPAKVAKPVKAVKEEKARKPKLVRDSFTIPKNEYTVLQAQKDRATKLTRPAKKSEILRAGVAALAAMSDVAFLDALARVPAIKTGRPGKD